MVRFVRLVRLVRLVSLWDGRPSWNRIMDR
jgi:hypothetical protein